MAIKPLTTEEIRAKFLYKELPVIQGEPTYSTINELIQAMYANAATVDTTLGGGRCGHVGIVMASLSNVYRYFTLAKSSMHDTIGMLNSVVQHAYDSTHQIKNFLFDGTIKS